MENMIIYSLRTRRGKHVRPSPMVTV